MRNTVTLNGISSSTIQGLLIQELPPISKPMIRTNIEEIDGRDGDIVTKLGYSAYDKEVSIGLYGNFDIDQVIAFFNTEGEVIFSNEPDKYYRYKILEQIDFERLIRFRTATVTFHVQPFKYSTTDETIEDSGTETKSGDIVSFISQGNDPLSSHKVNLSPIQNLNGYESPWVGGAGFNKLPYNSSGIGTITRNGITVAVNNGVFTISGTATAGDGINYPLTQSVDLSPSTNKIAFLNSVANGSLTVAFKRGNTTVHYWTMTPVNRVASGWIDSGNEVIDTISIQWNSSLSISGSIKVSPMLIALTETNPTAYIPYENICPIYPANGKNLLPYPYSSGTTLSTNGIDFTANADGSLKVKGTASANADFYFVGAYGEYVDANIPSGSYIQSLSRVGGEATTSVRIYFIENGGSTVYATEASPLSVTVDSTKTYRVFMRIMSGQAVDATYYPMVRPAEITSPTYVPYKGLEVTRTGKNLLPIPSSGTRHTVTFTVATDGKVTVNGTPSSTASYLLNNIKLKANTSYMLSGCPSGGGSGKYALVIYDGTEYLATDYGTGASFTPTEDVEVEIRIRYWYNYAISNLVFAPQLEIGSTATSYEPYQGEQFFNLDENNPSQDIYGGTLDVTTGVLTVTHQMRVMDGVTSSPVCKFSSKSGTAGINEYMTGNLTTISNYGFGTGGYYVGNDLIDEYGYWCSVAPTHYDEDLGASQYVSRLYRSTADNGTQIRIRFADDTIGTIAEANQWLADLNTAGTPFVVVFRLRTPQTYQLTPTQVQTLLGVNNIWTDSGTVEVAIPKLLTVVNEGNYISKPKITVYGTGTVGVYLNGVQAFSIDMDGSDYITIDAEKMEAYQGDILKNRKVTGDYSNFIFNVGENILSVSGNVTNLELENYSRWL